MYQTRGFLRWVRCGRDESVFSGFVLDFGAVFAVFGLFVAAADFRLLRRVGVATAAWLGDDVSEEEVPGDWWRRFRLQVHFKLISTIDKVMSTWHSARSPSRHPPLGSTGPSWRCGGRRAGRVCPRPRLAVWRRRPPSFLHRHYFSSSSLTIYVWPFWRCVWHLK